VSSAPRSYDSPRRRAAAEKSRRRIVDTAGRLFSENGYAGTSVQAIAVAAGTSPANIYLVFGTKAALLAAWVDVSVAGDDTPVMFVDRPEARALADLATVQDRLAAALSIGSAAYERVAAPLAVLDAAAQSDPAIAALAASIDAARRQDIGQLLSVVFGELPARADMSRAAIGDLVSALVSVHLYRALVLTAGWPAPRYERELGRQIRQAVLGIDAPLTTTPPP
jgi:AcrR family transcriptional regulator